MTTPMRRTPRNMPAPTSAENVKARYLMVLASQVGYREGRDADGDWNNDNAYGLWFGFNRVAWCHIFAYWASFVAGVQALIPKTAYTPTGWNWFVANNQDVTTPQAGDLFYVYGYVSSEKRNRVHHVGTVEKVLPGGYIQTLEGNTNNSGSSQGNGVYRLKRKITPSLRFARPDWAKAVKPAAKPPTSPPASGGGSGAVTTVYISLKACQYSATHPGQYLPGGTDDVVNVKARLVGLGIALASDSFRNAYRKWQLHLGYTGSDADGIPGATSLNVLCKNAGWVMVA